MAQLPPLVACLSLTVAITGCAAVSERPATAPVPAPPDFASKRPPMPDTLLRDKPEGRYLAPIPAIGYDEEEGFGIGAIAELIDNGERSDPLFAIAPYRSKWAFSAQWWTVGASTMSVSWDRPYVGGGPYRLRTGVAYGTSPTRNYHGLGNDAMAPLSYPGEPGATFTDFNSYDAALNQVANGRTWSRYNKWDSQDLVMGASIERDVAGGVLRPFLGFQFGHTWTEDFSGQQVTVPDSSGQEISALQNPTRLRTDCVARKARGCDGGWDNFVRLGLTYDTRDFEPDPSRGLHVQLAGNVATRLLGSDFEYMRATVSAAGFHEVIDRRRLIIAARGLYSTQSDDVPFFGGSTLAVNGFPLAGLGGHKTLRGHRRERFLGQSAANASVELRSSLNEGRLLFGQHLRPMLVGFADTGRVFEDLNLSFEDWRTSYGLGLRLAWNVATIVAFDLARSGEETIFYMELGHPF